MLPDMIESRTVQAVLGDRAVTQDQQPAAIDRRPMFPISETWLARLALALSLFIVAAYLLLGWLSSVPLILADGLFLVTSALAAVACFHAAGRLGANGRPWTFLGIGCLSWLVGQSLWDVSVISTGNPPLYPSIADIGFLGLYPFFFIGLLLIVTAECDEQPARDLVIDSLIVIVIAGSLLFSLVLEPLFESDSLSTAGLIASLLWLGGTFALVFLTSIALFWGAGTERRSLGTLLAGLVAFATANVIYARLALEDHYTAGHIIDIGWDVGFLLVAAAAMFAARGERERLRLRLHSQRRLRRVTLSRSGLLLVSLLSFTGLAIWGALSDESQPITAIGVGIVGLLLAVRLGYATLQSEWLNWRTTERDRLQGVLNASSTIAGTLDLDDLLRRLSQVAAESVGCLRGEVYLWNDDRSAIESCAFFGFSQEELDTLAGIAEVPIGAFEAEREIIRNHEPRIQRIDEDDLPEDFRLAFRRVGKVRTVVAPLLAHGRVIGTFDVWTPHDMRAFQEADLQAVRAVGQQAGLAVHNSRLLATSRRHAIEQQALLRVSQAAITQVDLRAVLGEIAHASLGIANAESCAIEFWHPEADETEMLAQAYAGDWDGPDSIGTRYPLGLWQSTRRVLTEQGTLNVLATDPALNHHEQSTFLNAGTRAVLVVPLVLRSASLGILTLFSRHERTYTDDEARLAHELAAQVALAIERAQLHEALQQRADTDGLTGLLNHRAILQRLDHELARARRTAGTVGVMMIDLDGFKRVNDTYGHQVGDQVLREMAALLRGTLREIDHIGRYGGDEFLVVLPNVAIDDLAAITSRLTSHIDVSFHLDTERVPFRLSVGAAIFPADGAQRDALIAIADTRMYADKAIHRQSAPELATPVS